MAAKRGTPGRRARGKAPRLGAAEIERDADIRRLYEDGVVSARRIAEVFGLRPGTLPTLIWKGGWQRRADPRPTDAAEGRECPGLRFCPARTEAVARLHNETCDEIKALAALDGPATDGGDRERRARTLASLTRTIERVQALDAGILAARPIPVGMAPEAGEHGYDVETLRKELEERIARLRGGRDDATPPEGS